MSSLMRRSNLFDEFFRDMSPGFYVRPLHGEPLPEPDKIKVDVKENDKSFTVLAEIPGVSKEDIHVSIDGNVITLSADVKQQDTQTKDDKVLRSERYYGSVSRAFSLPQDVDVTQAKAKCDNGVLSLTLSKKSNGGSQRIRID
ncbi:MAG: Hsp20/alpha crystallin family protein [Hylemonella sp.]